MALTLSIMLQTQPTFAKQKETRIKATVYNEDHCQGDFMYFTIHAG